MRTISLMVAALSTTMFAAPLPNDDAVGIIWTFLNGTWIENVAVRENGEILATSLSKDAIYLVNPFEHTQHKVHQFGLSEGVLGLAEIEADFFFFVTAEVNLTTSTATNGTAKTWTLNMTAWDAGLTTSAVKLVGRMSQATLPDGVVALPEKDLVLVADAAQGVLWRVNTVTGSYEVAIANDAFRPSPAIPLGVNGLHLAAGSTLYFTCTAQHLLGKVAIDERGSPAGPVQIVTSDLVFPDDFALQSDGTAYVAGSNTLRKVDTQGKVTVLAGGANNLVLEGITSAQFGRTSVDQDVLYLGTNGGLLVPVDGVVHGGQIAAVNINMLL